MPLPQYKVDLLRPLIESKCDIDTELIFTSSDLQSQQQQARNNKRPHRTGTLSYARGPNLFKWGFSKEIIGGLPEPRQVDGDFLRVQPVDSLRESDVCDTQDGLSAADRLQLLGRAWWRTVMGDVTDMAAKCQEFQSEATVERRSNKRAKKEAKQEGKVEAPAQPAQVPVAGNRPLLVVSLGLGNGSSGLAALETTLRTNAALFWMGVDFGQQECEFSFRRLHQAFYSKWASSEIAWGPKPVRVPRPLSAEVFGKFEAAPLAVTDGEGRLVVPASLLEEYETNEHTSHLVAAFKAEHYEKFVLGDICLARIRRALRGDDATSLSEGAQDPPPPLQDDDISSMDAVSDLITSGDAVAAVSSCGRYKVIVRNQSRVYVVVVTSCAGAEGTRIAGFGSGGFRSEAEAAELVTRGAVKVAPVIDKDTDMVLFQNAEGKETLTSLYCVLQEVLASGVVRDVSQCLVFHTITKKTHPSERDRRVQMNG